VPAVALGMEEAEPNVMDQQPRDSREGIFANGLGVNIVYQGLLTTALVLGAYFVVRRVWHDDAMTAATTAFVTMSMCEVIQAYALRSIDKSVFGLRTHNRFIWLAIIISLVATALVVYVPGLAAIFQLTPLGGRELALGLALAASILPIIEIVKWIQRRARLPKEPIMTVRAPQLVG
jgi:P-type Ca2+ transporter type 2C